LGYSPRGYGAILLLTLTAQLIGHGIHNYVLRRLSATTVAITSQLGTVISLILAFVFFHELPNELQIPGMIAMIVGVTFVNLVRSRPAEHQPSL
jgi:drug/metabolite transporter (DMT)-like permease